MAPARFDWRRSVGVPFPAIVGLLLAAKLALHLLALQHDDWFRDEFYYLACSRRLAWSYVDHPPLSVAFLALLGEGRNSFLLVRLIVFAIGCATLLVASLLTRALGGNATAQALAVFALTFSPGFLGLHSFYSMNAWEPLVWLAAAYLWVRLAQIHKLELWFVLGALFAVGLLNKLSMLWFAFPSLAAAALFWRHRSDVRAGIGVVVLMLLAAATPMLLWQMRHGWPTWEFMINATRIKVMDVSLGQFWLSQILVFGLLPVFLAILGACVCVLCSRWRWRGLVLGVSFLATAVLLSSSHGVRTYYLAPACAVVVPAGAAFLCSRRRRQGALQRVTFAVAMGLLALPGVAGLPLAIPLLSPEQTIQYAAWLRITVPREERFGPSELPQHLADRHGWQELASAVSAGVGSLPPEIREQVTIVTANYGEAGALEYYQHQHSLLQRLSVASPHNQYWFWAKPERWGKHFVTVGFPLESLRPICTEVRELTRLHCTWCRERGAPVAYCEYSGSDMTNLWTRLRRWI